MFERHYQLSGPPFGLTPPEHGFFDSASHGKALSYLRYGLQQANYFLSGPSIVDASSVEEAIKLSKQGVR